MEPAPNPTSEILRPVRPRVRYAIPFLTVVSARPGIAGVTATRAAAPRPTCRTNSRRVMAPGSLNIPHPQLNVFKNQHRKNGRGVSREMTVHKIGQEIDA